MKMSEIRKMARNYKGYVYDYNDVIKFNENIIEILKLCLKNNIKFEINQKGFIEIIKIYHEFKGVYYDEFIKKVLDNNTIKINLSSILNNLTK